MLSELSLHSFKCYLGYYIIVKPTFCQKNASTYSTDLNFGKKELHYDIVKEIVFSKHKTLSDTKENSFNIIFFILGCLLQLFHISPALLQGPSIQNKCKMTGK